MPEKHINGSEIHLKAETGLNRCLSKCIAITLQLLCKYTDLSALSQLITDSNNLPFWDQLFANK